MFIIKNISLSIVKRKLFFIGWGNIRLHEIYGLKVIGIDEIRKNANFYDVEIFINKYYKEDDGE